MTPFCQWSWFRNTRPTHAPSPDRFPDPQSRPADLGTEVDQHTQHLLCYHRLGTPQVGGEKGGTSERLVGEACRTREADWMGPTAAGHTGPGGGGGPVAGQVHREGLSCCI